MLSAYLFCERIRALSMNSAPTNKKIRWSFVCMRGRWGGTMFEEKIKRNGLRLYESRSLIAKPTLSDPWVLAVNISLRNHSG